MKITELKTLEALNEAANVFPDEPFTISKLKIEDTGEEDWVKISVAADSGPYMRLIKDLIGRFNTASEGKYEIKTKSGQPLKSGYWEKFKANGFLVKSADRHNMLQVIMKCINDLNKSDSALRKQRAKAPAERKEMAKADAPRLKALKDAAKEKYGSAQERVKSKQIGGDDGYQYAIMVDGRTVMNGLTKREVKFYVDQEIVRLAKKEKLGMYAEK